MHFDSPPDAIEQRQTAFDARRSWNGKPLNKFSIDRRRMFLNMRSISTSAAFGNPDSIFADSMRFVFLCAHTFDELFDFEARASLSRQPQAVELLRACSEWMEANEEALMRDQASIAEMFTETWLGISRVQPQSAMTGGDEPGK